MVSTGVDGLGEADGWPEGLVDGSADPVGDGLTEGAGVSSGGPESIDGAGVGGVVGTCPRLPDAEHAAVARSSVARARAGMSDR